MKRLNLLGKLGVIAVAALLAPVYTAYGGTVFEDNFDDGTIDTSSWLSATEGRLSVSEAGGSLTIADSGGVDYETAGLFGKQAMSLGSETTQDLTVEWEYTHTNPNMAYLFIDLTTAPITNPASEVFANSAKPDDAIVGQMKNNGSEVYLKTRVNGSWIDNLGYTGAFSGRMRMTVTKVGTSASLTLDHHDGSNWSTVGSVNSIPSSLVSDSYYVNVIERSQGGTLSMDYVTAYNSDNGGGSSGSSVMSPVGVVFDSTYLNGPHDVQVSGDYAYVAGKDGSFGVVDVSDPTNPTVRGGITGLRDPETVWVDGDIVYMGGEDFLAIDVSDPDNPTTVKTIVDSRIPSVNGMTRVGDYLFGASKGNHITVFDVSTPTDPSLVDALDTGINFGSPHDMSLLGDKLVVSNLNRLEADQRALRVYTVFDPAGNLLPSDQWTLEGEVDRPELGMPNRVVVAGNFAFTADTTMTLLGATDLSDPTNPTVVDTFDTGFLMTGLEVVGDLLIACGDDSVGLFDVSDPSSIVSLGTQEFATIFPGSNPGYSSGHDPWYRDGLIYVTGQWDDSVGVISIDDPNIIALVPEPATLALLGAGGLGLLLRRRRRA